MVVIAIVVGSISFFFLAGYKFYGGLIDRILVEPNDERKTPAHVHKEDADYDPAPKPVLFGHHFASIAGAGPIIGPIVALSSYGWAKEGRLTFQSKSVLYFLGPTLFEYSILLS